MGLSCWADEYIINIHMRRLADRVEDSTSDIISVQLGSAGLRDGSPERGIDDARLDERDTDAGPGHLVTD